MVRHAEQEQQPGGECKSASIACNGCGTTFSSRSQLFKHLKKSGLRCSIVSESPTGRKAQDDAAPDESPAGLLKAQKDDARGDTESSQSDLARKLDSKPKPKRTPAKGRRAIADAAATLWFGDIPQHLASSRRVGEVLYATKPRTMPTPHVRLVVKKAYRRGSRRDRGSLPSLPCDGKDPEAAAGAEIEGAAEEYVTQTSACLLRSAEQAGGAEGTGEKGRAAIRAERLGDT